MKYAYMATDAANMYCGSCMYANTLVAAQKSLGHDPELIYAIKGGLLHTPEDALGFSDKLTSLLSNGGKQQALGKNGETAVHNYFPAQRMAVEIIQTYHPIYSQVRPS